MPEPRSLTTTRLRLKTRQAATSNHSPPMNRIMKLFIVLMFLAFTASPAFALYYEGPVRDYTVKAFGGHYGIREWVSVRQSQTVSVRAEFCAGSFSYTVQGWSDRWALVVAVPLIIILPVLIYAFRWKKQR